MAPLAGILYNFDASNFTKVGVNLLVTFPKIYDLSRTKQVGHVIVP